MKGNIFKAQEIRQEPRQRTNFNNNNKNESSNRLIILEEYNLVRQNDYVREQRRYPVRIGSRNSFIDEKVQEKKRKEQQIVMSDNNFPVLIDNICPSTNTANSVNYASMVKKEKIQDTIDIEEKVPVGCVRIELKGRKIVYKYGEKTEDSDEEESLHDRMSGAVDQMIRRWEKYREDYIELYGFDNYEKYYTSRTEYISDEEEEDD